LALRERLRALSRPRRWLLVGGGGLALLLLLWLVAKALSPPPPAPFTPGAAEQREVSVGGETLDLQELERASREADAVARQLETELGVQPDEAESR
jgi:hypothetical protein